MDLRALYRGTAIVERALQYADRKQSEQHPEDPNPSLSHPETVAQLISVVRPKDVNLIAAALLHDNVQDAFATYEQLADKFNKDVADLVKEVTRSVNSEGGFYYPSLLSERAIALQLADRLSNFERMGSWSQEKTQRYLRQSQFWKTRP
jgi:guanosine-3',5'-bis(diphosphate) 3'-pyrophosphohydrolase